MKRNDSLRSDDASSIHSHDSWTNASLDEEEKSKDTEDVVPVSSKRTGKAPEGEVGSKRDDNYERRDKRNEKSASDMDARKKQQEFMPATGKDGKDVEDGRPPPVSGYDQRSQKPDQGGEARRSSRGNDPRRENREYKSGRDNREQGKGDKVSNLQDQIKEDRPSKERQRGPRKENEANIGKKEIPTFDSDVRRKDVKLAKDLKQVDRSKETPQVTQKEKQDMQESSEKDDRRYPDKISSSSSKPKTISDNFKRLEKQKGKSLSLKGSTTVEKEKRSVKSEQKNGLETKKPPVWSQVVSGETADRTIGSAVGKIEDQPKKSLVEIQKEEEIQNEKENLEQFNKESKERQLPFGDRYSNDLQKESRIVKDRKQDNRKQGERRQDDRRQDDRRQDDRRQDERRQDERRQDERRQDERRQDERRQDERRQDERRQDERRQDERRFDSRYSSRRANERYEDHYSDRHEHTAKRRTDRDMRRAEDKFDRKRADGEDKETLSESKYDGGAGERGYDGRKRGLEDRKRRHDETEKTIDPYERIYFEEVEAEGRMREQKIEKQKSIERRQDRTKYQERIRGVGRGRQPFSRGKGRGIMAERHSAGSKEGYPFSDAKPYINEKENSSEDRESAKLDVKRSDTDYYGQKDDKGAMVDSRGIRKEKENREPRLPSNKSESSHYESRRVHDQQSSFDYSEKAGHRQERSQARRGRISSRKYDYKKDPTNDGKSDRKIENGSSENRSDDAKAIEKAKSGKEDLGGGDDYEEFYDEDEQYEDEEEYTDNEGDESDVEKGERENTDEKGNKEEKRRRPSDRGPPRVLSTKTHKSRQRDHRGYEPSLNKSVIPPRFQRHRSAGVENRRGRSYGIRGSRGRGRSSRGTRGQGFGKPSYSRDSRPKSSDGKGEDYSDDSDEEYHSAEEAPGSTNEESNRAETKFSRDHSKRYNERNKPSTKSSRGRSTRRGGSADHFLGDRQQDRVGHIDASGLADTLPAAGKAFFADQDAAEEKYVLGSPSTRGGFSTKRQIADQKALALIESQQEFSEPPKKMAKSKSIEKQEFLRQYDVNNIASVVCVDDMPQNDGEGEDGFVEVCNRKKQKARNTEKVRQKEEEKKKLQEDSNVKSSKRTAGDAKEASAKSSRQVKAVEQHTQRVTQSFSPVTCQTQLTSVSQSQASNAAMAAVGGWEPAQALLRGVQMVSQVENLDVSKPVPGPTQPPINAWKRPLSFAASLSSSSVTSSGIQAPAPDPKAVGTGKPNASPAKQVGYISLIVMM